MSAPNPTTAGHGYDKAYLLLPYDPSQAMKPSSPPASIAASVGGGGASDFISYPGPPVVSPPLIAYIVVDSVGQQWMYYNNQWN